MSIYMICLFILTIQIVFALTAVLYPIGNDGMKRRRIRYEKTQVLTFVALVFGFLVGLVSVFLMVGSYITVTMLYWLYWTEYDIPNTGLIRKYRLQRTMEVAMFDAVKLKSPSSTELAIMAVMWLPYVIVNIVVGLFERRRNR